jgi:hypothetical protein
MSGGLDSNTSIARFIFSRKSARRSLASLLDSPPVIPSHANQAPKAISPKAIHLSRPLDLLWDPSFRIAASRHTSPALAIKTQLVPSTDCARHRLRGKLVSLSI